MANTVVVPISLTKTLARQVDRLAKQQDMTRSELVRDAIRRRLAFVDLRYLQSEFARQAGRAQVRTLRDSVRLVRTVRTGRTHSH